MNSYKSTVNGGSTTKLVAVIGPTASGKTDLAIRMAEMFNGEIVCADSKTIYRHMNIGTAKPTPQERARVPHHMLDIVDPDQSLNVAEFKKMADEIIDEIALRNKVPFLVGGSGLYVDSILYDYRFPRTENVKLREMLESKSDEDLRYEFNLIDPMNETETDIFNRRRLIRVIESGVVKKLEPRQPRPNVLIIGLMLNKEVIRKRIEKRVELMLSQGFIEEVASIGKKYGWDSEAMSAIGYRSFKNVIIGNKSVKEGVDDFVTGDMKLVKKQFTWFKKNRDIIWIEKHEDARILIENFLNEADNSRQNSE